MAGAKQTPRQKMIGMMYLVLTALLALNISKEVLNGFVKVENSLLSTQVTIGEKVDETYATLKAKYLNNQEKVGPFYQKAEEVNKKYVDSAISAEFACVYIPSESLYHEVTTHVNEDKELWISKIQDKTKVTFMGPSTFAAYCSAILLGFNQIEGDRKAKMFVKHLEALTNSIDQLNETTLKHENNLKKSYTDAQAVTSTAEKMKTNLQRIKEEIDNIDESKN